MFEIRFVAPDLRRLDEAGAEIVACAIWKDERPLRGLAGLLDWRLAGRLSRLAKEAFLLGDAGEVLAIPARPRLPFDKALVVGLGLRASFTDAACKKALSKILDALSGLSVKKAVVEIPGRGGGDEVISAERAADVLFDVLGDEDRDALFLVEPPDAQKRIEKQLQEKRQRAMRSLSAQR
jgi:hypothetical protein